MRPYGCIIGTWGLPTWPHQALKDLLWLARVPLANILMENGCRSRTGKVSLGPLKISCLDLVYIKVLRRSKKQEMRNSKN
jgi:hypothetical protein